MIRNGFRRLVEVFAASALVVVALTSWPSREASVSAQHPDPEPVANVVPIEDASDDRPHPERDRVVVIGDSITYLSDAAIHAALDPRHDVAVDGVPGIKVAEQSSTAHRFAQSQPEVAIINLGTNDLLSQRDPSVVIDELQAMASEFGPRSCVVFVTLTTHVTNDDFEHRATELNRWIRGQAHVADWDSSLAADPQGQLTTDTIHPNEQGQALMAQLLEEQVDACTAR